MAGRPSKYTTAGEIEAEIQEDFSDESTRKTITGLAYHLGFESRQSFYDYEKDGEFSYTLKRARLRIEMGYEEGLHTPACTGSIFALKNFGWRDKIETGFTNLEGKDIVTAPLTDSQFSELLNQINANSDPG